MNNRITRRGVLMGGSALAGAMLVGFGHAAAQGTQDMVYFGWSHEEPGSKPFFDKLFADFRAANPSVNLEVVGVPFAQFETTLLLRKRSDQRVDVAQMSDRALAPFVAAGGLADVDEIFGADAINAKFDATALKMATIGGKRYGLPWVTGTIGLVSNAKVMAAAGLSTTPAPATFEEWLEMLRAIKKAVPSSSPFGLSTKSAGLAQFESQLIFWNYGARVMDDDGNVAVDSDEARAALTMLTDMVKEGLILPGNDRFDFRALFAKELVGFYPDQPLAKAFARDLSGQGEAYEKNVVAVKMPVAKAGMEPISILGGHIAIFPEYGGAKPAPDSPAGKFADLITSTPVQTEYYKVTGFFPTTKEAIAALKDDTFFVTWNEANANARVDELGVFLNAGDLRTIVGEEIIASMLGQKSPDEAITSMAERLKAANPRK
jgi:multiple sugar transport system substrate-binding protein